MSLSATFWCMAVLLMEIDFTRAFVSAPSSMRVSSQKGSFKKCSLSLSKKAPGTVLGVKYASSIELHTVSVQTTRRAALASLLSWSILLQSADATTGRVKTSQYAGASSTKRSRLKPETAFEGLLQARNELELASKNFIAKKDYDGLRTFLSDHAENLNSFEENALAILASKKLDDEDKKAIGTIRRYGAGADVLIMYGGLLAEIDEANDEPDEVAVKKYLSRTIDSLDEVIDICRNGGFEG